jgi:hypothetical protein
MERHAVQVSGHLCGVQVYRLATNVWIAEGDFLGDQLRARGSTAGKAVKAWHEVAGKRLLADEAIE